MFNPLNLISKFIRSGNQKELERLKKITQQINSLEEDVKKLENKQKGYPVVEVMSTC